MSVAINSEGDVGYLSDAETPGIATPGRPKKL